MASVIENQRDTQDVVDFLTADHAQMLDLLGLLKDTLDPEGRRQLADTLIAEVVRHSVAEEAHVYPALDKQAADGTSPSERAAQSHGEIVEVMRSIEGLDTRDAAFPEHVRKFEGLLREHARVQESREFPQLRAALSTDDLIELRTKVEKAIKLAPTRPRPDAPHSELFHKTVGAGVGMVDRLRDRLTGRTPT